MFKNINSNQLFIGLNGYAGSGKDTVAKMLKFIFNADKSSTKKKVYELWKLYNKAHRYATSEDNILGNTMTIAFADQLKKIASDIFGISIQRFYDNKANGYINISGNFEYTENKPSNNEIITAEDYASGPQSFQNGTIRYYMSIREILVYVGTFILQKEINKNTFVNIVENKVNTEAKTNEYLKYVICTDVRFGQEVDYIRKKHGIFINIIRNDVKQLGNIAEHDLDEETGYDFTIENDGTYEDLWDKVWDLVHSQDIFKNETIQLASHDYSNNYLRLVDEYSDENKRIYVLCPEYDYMRCSHSDDGSIFMVDPSGGPMLSIGYEFEYGPLSGWTITRIETKTEPFGFFVTVEK